MCCEKLGAIAWATAQQQKKALLFFKNKIYSLVTLCDFHVTFVLYCQADRSLGVGAAFSWPQFDAVWGSTGGRWSLSATGRSLAEKFQRKIPRDTSNGNRCAAILSGVWISCALVSHYLLMLNKYIFVVIFVELCIGYLMDWIWFVLNGVLKLSKRILGSFFEF